MTTDTQNGIALAVRDVADLAPRFVVSLDALRRQLADLEEFKRDIMVRGTDYGEIPGTDKPTLLKPGAEKLTLAFGLAPVPKITSRIEDWENGLFHYEVQCDLVSKRTGEVVASAHGSANSREPRYRWRKGERQCPNCGKAAIIKGKAQYGGGWLCWANRGGCSAKFADGDQKIEGQQVGNIANPEPFELVNTILKMAEKRALVAATLIATGGSGTWTQDVEDMPSVSGEFIDVTPAVEMVTNADSPLWKRWLKLSADARGMGVRVSSLSLPIAVDELTARGRTVATDLKAKHEQLAKEDAARSEPMVTAKTHPLWKSYVEAAAMAHDNGAQFDDVTLPVSEQALKAATQTLLEMLDKEDAAV